jgi:hypothetical protein
LTLKAKTAILHYHIVIIMFTKWLIVCCSLTSYSVGSPKVALEKGKDWWSFQPLKSGTTSDLTRDKTVDFHLQQALSAVGLKPAPEANRHILLRRVCFDLTGLPPSAEQTEAFLRPENPLSYETLVDQLLASRAHAEHQARLWLDLVRYADSDGYKADDFRPHAWRYRDWVVESFHTDLPYSRFVALQLAGDELEPHNPAAHIATGYLRQGIYEYNNRDVVGQRSTMLNDITDNVADVFMGLGLQCARCHDHKFDPLLQEDYYRLQAFFAPLNPKLEADVGSPEEHANYLARLEAWKTATKATQGEIDTLLAPFLKKAEDDAVGRFPPETRAILTKPAAERTPWENQVYEIAWRQIDYDKARVDSKVKGSDKERLLALRKMLSQEPPPLQKAHVARDVGATAPPNPVPGKQELPDVAPGIPVLFSKAPMPVKALAKSTGRRAALAEWMGNSQNFLTSRVIVNRLWQQHFGKGLCVTTSDFGLLGEAPSHPELLDWLAQELINNGWHLKPIHRLIVTSAAYKQQATPADAEATKLKDPQNRLLSHWSIRRLTAEQIRDAALAASGELDLASGGPAVDFGKPRRSLYLKVLRNVRDPVLEAFDAPQHINSSPERHTTTTPLQSLLLSNHPWMLERSQNLARRVEKAASAAGQAISHVWQRAATSPELASSQAFLAEQAEECRRMLKQGEVRCEAMPQRSGQAVVFAATPEQSNLLLPPNALSQLQPHFSLETVVLLRSVYPSGEVRTVLSNWNGDEKTAGWSLGVSGQQSRRRPQVPLFQVVGKDAQGNVVYDPIFSDFQIQLDRSYYLACSFQPAKEGSAGQVTFYLKDLANDDEPLQTCVVPHRIAEIPAREAAKPVVLGGRDANRTSGVWDGLVDEIRLSNGPLEPTRLAYLQSEATPQTLLHYTMETAGNALSEVQNRLSPLMLAKLPNALTPESQALADYCQMLLSSSEFLYLQ